MRKWKWRVLVAGCKQQTRQLLQSMDSVTLQYVASDSCCCVSVQAQSGVCTETFYITILTTFGVVMVTTQAFTTKKLGDIHYQIIWFSLHTILFKESIKIKLELCTHNSQVRNSSWELGIVQTWKINNVCDTLYQYNCSQQFYQLEILTAELYGKKNG